MLIFAGVIIEVCELPGSTSGQTHLLKNLINYVSFKLRWALGLLVKEF